jgi:hypothetical protein
VHKEQQMQGGAGSIKKADQQQWGHSGSSLAAAMLALS